MLRAKENKIVAREEVAVQRNKLETIIPLRVKSHQIVLASIVAEINEIESALTLLNREKINPVADSIAAINAQINKITLPTRLNELGEQIAQLEKRISDFNAKIEFAKEQLVALDNSVKRETGQLNYSSVDVALKMLMQDKDNANNEKIVLDAEYSRINKVLLNAGAVHSVGIYANTRDIQKLESEKKRCEQQKKELIDCRNQYSAKVANFHIEAALQQTEISKLNERLFEIRENQHLMKLIYDPQLLIDELCELINEKCSEYENFKPTGQCDRVRACLRRLPLKIQFIQSLPENNNEQHLLKYFEVLGLVRHVKLCLIEVDRELAARFQYVLTQHPVMLGEIENDDYHHLKSLYPAELADFSLAELRQQEQLDYADALHRFEHALNLPPQNLAVQPLIDGGKILLRNIEFEKRLTHLDDFDFKFHTNLLRAAHDVLLQPTEIKHQSRLTMLAEHNPASPETKSRANRGVTLMLIGAAIAVISVLFAGFTFGFTSPVMIAGVALGGSLMVAGLSSAFYARQRSVETALNGYKQLSLFQQGPARDVVAVMHGAPGALTI
jgi:hypothetical protein